jgi:hypothetical protein
MKEREPFVDDDVGFKKKNKQERKWAACGKDAF